MRRTTLDAKSRPPPGKPRAFFLVRENRAGNLSLRAMTLLASCFRKRPSRFHAQAFAHGRHFARSIRNAFARPVRPAMLRRRRPLPFSLLLLVTCLAPALHAGSPLEDAIVLYKQKNYPAARAAFAAIADADPANAEACHYLGLTLSRRADTDALDEAVTWLAKAVALRPENPDYLGDYGGVCLQLADRRHSYRFAQRGREALEKCLVLDPDNLDARDGLMQFFQEAPWPLGDRARARAQAEEIRKRDPRRGLLAFIYLRRSAKDDAGVFALCEDALARDPDNYTALFELGRTSATTGSRLDRGIAALHHCLTLTPPPHAPGFGQARKILGALYEKSGDIPAARAAYAAALKLRPDDPAIAAALARLPAS